MRFREAYDFIFKLSPEQEEVVYECRAGEVVSVIRTDKKCEHDFAVKLGLSDGEKFSPQHTRLLIDLFLKKISSPDQFKLVLPAFERIYGGDDPQVVLRSLPSLSFRHQLDSLEANLCYTQLLMIEQEYNYGPIGKRRTTVNPPREFLMRFIRWLCVGDTRIEGILYSAVNNKPPPDKYATPGPPTL